MQAVIGTAGHVDHGKSALLQALTGTHPSHLPQEFARGMTIDLGFACLKSPAGDEIGMIDVPGHERFLRNMVSSLWGLDLVLFVVAADEGWAPLTQEHLRVVTALGLDQIVVAISKCDLADEQQIQRVEEQILEQFLQQCDLLPDIYRVSSKTGEGIEGLRDALIEQVRALQGRSPLIPFPHLYIDRVFSVQGIGTTVTGTLRGGPVSLDTLLRLQPGGQTVKVKSLQSYHRSHEQVQPHSRVAMSFRQLKKQLVARGDCLTLPDAPVTVSQEWIVQLRPEFGQLKRQCELEVAVGTAHTTARCSLLAGGVLARLRLSQPIAVFWGQPLLLMSAGGSHLTGSGRVVWTGLLTREQRPRLVQILQQSSLDQPAQTQCNVQMALKGYTPCHR
ncbi:MAG: selenocysteine-specific translation elongation factor, partial [Enterobacteriaceae bacterium]